MLYLCLVALIAGCTSAKESVVLSSPQLSQMGIIMPLGAESVSSACLKSSVYTDNEELAKIPVGSEDEAYYCAFAAFQANNDKQTNLYASEDEAADRFAIFKNNVDSVNAHNADKTKSWTMGINFFADMTDAEKQMRMGLKRPGFGIGA